MIPVSVFDSCLASCSEGKPAAAQQLANLQKCASVACKGCQDLGTTRDVGETTP
jgi:hypothetical protein